MIYLARHGQTEYNAQKLLNGQYDDPLSNLGREQAKILAEKCFGFGIEIIYSSQLIRSFVTAQIVAKILGVKRIVSTRELNERNFGKMTHQPESKIPEFSGRILRVNENSVYFLSGEEVETFPELSDRVYPVYHELTKLSCYPTDKKILVISHGDVMKAIEAIHRRVHFLEVLKEGHYQNCQIVPLT